MTEITPQFLRGELHNIVREELGSETWNTDDSLERIFKNNRKALTRTLGRLHLRMSQVCDVHFEGKAVASLPYKHLANAIHATAADLPGIEMLALQD